MTGDDRRRSLLRVEITNAARLIQPLWPIERFIAVNPLVGLIDLHFDVAVGEARRWFGARGYPDAGRAPGAGDAAHGSDEDPAPPAPGTVAERLDARRGTATAAALDAEVARWCALLADRADETPHLGPGGGLYQAWRAIAPHDRRLRRLAGRSARLDAGSLPERADDAILLALDRLGVDEDDRPGELRGQLTRLPGWSGYAKWCDEWAVPEDPNPRIRLIDLLAVRLSADALAVGPATSASRDVADSVASTRQAPTSGAPGQEATQPPGAVLLESLEDRYRTRLLDALDRQPPPPPDPVALAAQVVFCIDARSERLRRRLEEQGPYETIGFAGFFATPIRYRSLGSEEAYASAPVLLTPEVEVREAAAPGSGSAARSHLARDRRRAAAAHTYDALSHGPLSMFALAEMAGWLLGPASLARTLRPRPPTPVVDVATEVRVDAADGTGFTLDERALVAETALRTMGLTRGFAPVVLLCGHGATTTANPHAAGLDCGACGGNRGGPNARAAAAIANDPEVRAELRSRGIDIPDSTWFLAGEHDTTTDTFVLFDQHLVPTTHHAARTRLATDLAAAGEAVAAARLRTLPGASRRTSAHRQARARAGDWAETRPEWGLARNAAFIVGPRDLTRGVDLDGRAFLHSYDAGADAEGTALETILTAPMVVAHWINAQYYFSTVDPELYGAGDKTLHNPIPGIGVVLGAGGDLRSGLPWQSVAVGDTLYHEPLRLLTVIQAPRPRIDTLVSRNPILRHLFDGAWVHLVARDHPGHPWHRRLPGGEWQTVPSDEHRHEGVPA